ncbi:MAG: pilus assembly protein PilM [Anaerovoracaceae bacterium]|nr:pilus assembly protein PilM [Anaerovoracaceae bacterium]
MAGKNDFICIEIGSAFIRIVQVKGKNKKYKVLHATEHRMPEGIVYGGYVHNIEAMAELIKDCMAQAQMSGREAIISLISNKIVSREADIPVMKDKLVYEMIKNQAADYFPMDIADYAVSCSIMKREADHIHIMVYAMPTDLIEQTEKLAGACGLKLRSIEFSGHAAYQYMMQRLKADRNILLLQVHESVTRAYIIDDGAVGMQRNINYGTGPLQDVVVGLGLAKDRDEAFEVLSDRLKVGAYMPGSAMRPAEPEETEASAASAGDGGSSDDESSYNMSELLSEAARPIVTNVLRLIEYYSTRNREFQLEEIIISDLGEYVNGLAELIRNETGMKVTLAKDMAKTTVFTGPIPAERPGCFLSAAGAALAPLGFALDSVRSAEEKKANSKNFILTIVAGVLVCVLLISVQSARYAALNSARTELEAQKEELKPIETVYDAYIKARDVNTEVNAIDDSTNRMNEYLSNVFDELEQKLPSTSVITSMNSGADVLTMSMKVDSKETAAELLMQLKDIVYFSDVQISSLTDTTDEQTGSRKVEFTVACYYDMDAEKAGGNGADGANDGGASGDQDSGYDDLAGREEAGQNE